MFVSLRKLGVTENPIATAFWYNTFGAVVFTIYCSSFLGFEEIPKTIWFVLIVIGLLAKLLGKDILIELKNYQRSLA